MTDTFKTLFQENPGAASLTDAYAVPALTSTVVSTIVICNRSAVPTAFRISIAPAGAVDDPKQYLYYDTPINANATVAATLGITLATADVIRVYATLATLTFSGFGVQVT